MNNPRRWRIALPVHVILLLLISVVALAAEPERGRQLYENHCTGCHESNAHIRATGKAGSIADIRAQIVRWRGFLELPWSNQEIDDVLNFLNEQYYHYPPGQQ
jgi:mono/diheme cytochrome c family protein